MPVRRFARCASFYGVIDAHPGLRLGSDLFMVGITASVHIVEVFAAYY